MLVSMRGAPLAQLEEEHLLELDPGQLAAFTNRERIIPAEVAEALRGRGPNAGIIPPTTDAILYSLLLSLDGITVAAHVHPVEICQIVCSPKDRQFAERRIMPSEILSCGPAALLVPFAEPGLPHAREARRKLDMWKERFKQTPRLVLLQNHGMIALGASAEELYAVVEMSIKSAQVFIGASILGGPTFLTPHLIGEIEALETL
jgi:rhamnose utilization protein RhaD (predicted bifunctional aldolase and dehydrogenase)